MNYFENATTLPLSSRVRSHSIVKKVTYKNRNTEW